tara:strand:- start:1712 stop:2422 length:711 start_codon:yes stop_codon:yes gene_type:complete
MVNIGSAEFYIGVPSLPHSEFEEYSSLLFDDWQSYVDGILQLGDYSLSLNVEEGSLKAVAKIAATSLSVLYVGIAQYGSFFSGLETIESQVSATSQYFNDRAGVPFESSNVKPKTIKRGESLARLRNIFAKVQRRQITVEEAMLETEAIFGPEIRTVQGFSADLEKSFDEAPLFPQQILLPFESIESNVIPKNPKKPTKPRFTQPIDPAPVPEKYRVEVWRKRKRGRRNMRVFSVK